MNLSIRHLLLALVALLYASSAFSQITVAVNFSTTSSPDGFYDSVVLNGISGFDQLSFTGSATAGSGFEFLGDGMDYVKLTLAFYDLSGLKIASQQFAQFGGELLNSVTYQSILIGGTAIQQTATPVQWSIVIPNHATSASLSFYGWVTDGASEYANLTGSLSAANVSAIPEPSTYAALLGAAALAFVGWRRRRNHFC